MIKSTFLVLIEIDLEEEAFSEVFSLSSTIFSLLGNFIVKPSFALRSKGFLLNSFPLSTDEKKVGYVYPVLSNPQIQFSNGCILGWNA